MSSKSKPRDRGRDRDREDEGSKHGSSSGRPRDGHRDGSRDGRDREQRPSWREADRQGDGGRDSRPVSGQQASGKPSAGGSRPGAPAAARPTGPLLGNSVISNAILEAAKRRAQEQAAAAPDAADADAQAAGGGPRKRAKHDPIIWSSPRKEAADEGGRPSSQPESAADRLHREAAEFKQLQQQLAGSGGGGGRGGRSSRSRTPELPSSQQQRRHRGRSRSSSSSRSSSPHEHRRPRGRWQEEEEEEQPQKQQPQQPGKSRWVEEEPAADEVEEGEAPAGDLGTVGAALDEELEALNRRERAELEAGSSDDGGGGGGLASGPGPHSSDDEGEQAGQAQAPAQKNMLEESRRVEEYERLNRISEGTYGVVHRARCKATGKIFALKKLKLEACGDGFPQTSVREMNVLLSLHHPNIVNVSEIVIGGRDNIYMVMEYVEHDLKYVLELQNAKKAPPFSIGQVKFLMKQLLEGVAYLHHNWVLHRDLKTSNLLYSNSGELKICDFGLARQYGDPLRPYTPMVVTLWYRSIERLLNDSHYSTALDMWSVGCIMGELILGEPLFQGRGELDQIKQIFALLGTPTQESWPGWDKIGDNKNMQWKPQESKLRKKFPTTFFGGSKPVLNDTGFDLLSRLLEMNPERRISAEDALAHTWFSEAPRPVTAALMPGFPARHQQGKEAFRDKMGKPSPGAVGVVGFGI